jgi:uncharacterized protein YndB with AHSA1/START domain
MSGPETDVWWRLHLTSSPEKVFDILATDEGRSKFWAESAVEEAGSILFTFPGGYQWRGRILDISPPDLFSVEYIGGSITVFTLADDGEGGTDLLLTDDNIPSGYVHEVSAGWVSVLMALKGAVDFGIDLRNHDDQRTYSQGYADN